MVSRVFGRANSVHRRRGPDSSQYRADLAFEERARSRYLRQKKGVKPCELPMVLTAALAWVLSNACRGAQVVRIRREAFPMRITYKHFYRRFGNLVSLKDKRMPLVEDITLKQVRPPLTPGLHCPNNIRHRPCPTLSSGNCVRHQCGRLLPVYA